MLEAMSIGLIAAIILIGIGFVIYLVGNIFKPLFGKRKEMRKTAEDFEIEPLVVDDEVKRNHAQKTIVDELEKKRQETLRKEREAIEAYKRETAIHTTEERKLDGEKLWKAILELHLKQIRKDLPTLSMKKQQYYQVGDYGEGFFDSRGWASELRYYIGAVLCKYQFSSPNSVTCDSKLDGLVGPFIETICSQPAIYPFFEKYLIEERPGMFGTPIIDRNFNKIYWTCHELERLVLEYLGNYYKYRPYTEAMIAVIERMIENYDNVSYPEDDKHP